MGQHVIASNLGIRHLLDREVGSIPRFANLTFKMFAHIFVYNGQYSGHLRANDAPA